MKVEEFFEDTDGRASMSRLLSFMSFPPATYSLFKLDSENALMYYLGAFVIGYIGGKFSDAYQARGSSRYTEGDLKWQRS